MYLTHKAIFWKCWLWSIIAGIVVAALFYFLSSITNIFHGSYGGTIFLDLLLSLSILGSFFGAGFVGWRIVDKYYHAGVRPFVRRFVLYSILSFVLLAGIIYSPVSFLAILWSFVAPLCVLGAISKAKTLASPKG
ncbi:MAG TPA: hypothetical protein VHT70_02650 [Candidatus Saccharimonadales bacterium]|jgi:hypothetical protein|nr:hypothetical protein [Candidatus Saccharimonadales bacterium]